VIVVAVTALSAFSLPNYNFSFAIRTLRFIFILVAGVWGFYGITLGILVLFMHWVSLKSFGVPMMSPISPFKPSSTDVVLRGPVYMQEKRPRALRPLNTVRQRNFTRTWDPRTHDSEEARNQNANNQVNGNFNKGGENRD
jgi:spore germination protein KA